MKIKDLIKDLSEYADQEMEVRVFDRHHPDSIAFKITHTSISNRAVLIEIETSPRKEVKI
jgi:hypothetical protein